MNKEEIKSIIINIIADIIPDEDCSNLNDEKALREQLDLDSMDFLDIVMEIRRKYSIDIPEEDYPQLASLNSCANYLEPKMKDL